MSWRDDRGGIGKVLLYIVGGLVLIAIIATVSGGGGEDTDTTNNAGDQPGVDQPGQEPVTGQPQGAAAEHAFGERVQTEEGIIIVHSYDDAVPKGEFGQVRNPADHFAAIDVEQCAQKKMMSVNPLYFELQMGDNTRRDSFAGTSKEPRLNSGDLQPGQCNRGWVTFEVPAKPAKVIYERPFGGDNIVWRVP